MDKQRPLIGVILNEADKEFYARSAYCLQRELFAADMDVVMFSSALSIYNDDYVKADNAVFTLINSELIDGFIIYPNSIYANDAGKRMVLDTLKTCGKPVVSVDAPVSGVPSELYDYKSAVDSVVEHVTGEHGIRSVAYVGGYDMDGNYHSMISGFFINSIREHGCELTENDIYCASDWNTGYDEAADKMLENGLPKAVICCSDITAAGMISALARKGVNVDELVITGFSKNEPYTVGEYLSVTSVSRDSRSMSINAARRMISAIRGIEFEPFDSTDYELVLGSSCKFASEHHAHKAYLENLAKRADIYVNEATRTNDGFNSNYNFMSEELIGCDDLTDFLWKLDWYTLFLGEDCDFWLCLNENVMHEPSPGSGYAERVSMVLSRENKKGNVDLTRTFPTNELLPAVTEPSDKPRGFIFTTLQFCGLNFGYAVLSYKDSGRVYDRYYIKWLRNTACALEKQHRHILYNDAVAQTQVRDALTGLLNMRGYTGIMKERRANLLGKGKLLRIISIDVENLKGINNVYGYAEGDKLLTDLASIMRSSANDGDISVRVSGDEFFIAGIIDDESDDRASASLERNVSMLNMGRRDYGVSLYTARVTAPLDGERVIETLPYDAAYQRTLSKDSHTRMRGTETAKSGAFDPEERKQVVRLLNENLFSYSFQPIVSAKTGDIFAYEALMRSGREFRLSPVTILNHAEALGRLGDIEKYTMMNVFAYLKENAAEFSDKLLFINCIPSSALPDAEFEQLYRMYSDVMERTVIEFTEQNETSPEQFDTLQKRSRRGGFKIAVDDYGTGYSNISSLLNFSPYVVKIDRSLIMNIHKDRRKQHFTKNIIDYAHDNSFLALAEGVELTEELGTVIAMGVDLIQGFYTAKPSEELVERIDRDVADEILRYNRAFECKRPRKTYFTASEKEISLMTLDFDNYTDMIVNKSEYTIRGNTENISEMQIRTADGIECTLTLEDVYMKNDSAGACVSIGKNCSVTLVINGRVEIDGAVEVPEGSSLKITGGGTLKIYTVSNSTYAIGAPAGSPYGNIGIYLKNALSIYIESDKSAAIGGGIRGNGSVIDIETRELSIEQKGKHTVAVGSFAGGAEINMRNTAFKSCANTQRNLCFGCFDGAADVDISGCLIKMAGSGDLTVFAGNLGDKDCRFSVSQSELAAVYNAKAIRVFGGENGAADVSLKNLSMNMELSGAKVLAIGSESRRGRLELAGCSGRIRISSGDWSDLGFDKENISVSGSTLEISANT